MNLASPLYLTCVRRTVFGYHTDYRGCFLLTASLRGPAQKKPVFCLGPNMLVTWQSAALIAAHRLDLCVAVDVGAHQEGYCRIHGRFRYKESQRSSNLGSAVSTVAATAPSCACSAACAVSGSIHRSSRSGIVCATWESHSKTTGPRYGQIFNPQ